MNLWKHYLTPKNLSEAQDSLASAQGTVRLVAGGTDLLLEIEQGHRPPVDTLIDVTAITEMCQIEVQGNHLFVGAAVPLNAVAHSPLVIQHAQALSEASALIGGPQLRNIATLGGNVAHALPAGDGTIALLCLNAQAEIVNPEGERRVALPDLFLGPGKSALDPRRDILVGFTIPLYRPNQASAFRRVMRPQGVAIAILNMGLWLERQGDTLADVRLAIGPSGPTPRWMTAAEDCLRGRSLTGDALQAAVHALLEQASFRTSKHRASQTYRRHLAEILLRSTLTAAWERAGFQETNPWDVLLR